MAVTRVRFGSPGLLSCCVNLGSVSPAGSDLRPGGSKSITAAFTMPAQPGDLAAAIRFGQSQGSEPQSKDRSGVSGAEIPVTLRTGSR